MRHILDKAIALAALVAIVWTAAAAQIAAQSACSGPTVALVKPFAGGLVAAGEQGSGS
jgi:hypothetical protein